MIYHVIWEIDIDADSLTEAAEIAREIQQNPISTATVFTCLDELGIEICLDLGSWSEI